MKNQEGGVGGGFSLMNLLTEIHSDFYFSAFVPYFVFLCHDDLYHSDEETSSAQLSDDDVDHG